MKSTFSIDCDPGGTVHQCLIFDAVSTARCPAGVALSFALWPNANDPAAAFVRHKKEAIVSHDDADRAIQMCSLPVIAGGCYRSHLALGADLPDCAIASVGNKDIALLIDRDTDRGVGRRRCRRAVPESLQTRT